MASSGGIHFMQHPPHLQPVYYQVAPRPAVYPGMVGFMPGPVPAHAGGLFPLVGPGRLPPAGQTPERERPSGWGGAPLGQREGSAERQYSGQIELPGSLGSSPVASTYLNNGAFRGPFDEASSAPPASHGGAAGGHSRHRSRDEDSATPCPFYMKTATCAYGDICKFFHPSTIPPVLFNSIGLPMRPGEPNCRFYMQTMRCDYGPSCKYNHPEPCHAAGPAWRPPAMSWGPHMQLPVPGNGWRPVGAGHGPHAAGGGALGPGLEPRRSNGGGHGGLRALRGSRPQPQSPAASAASIAAATAAAAAAAAAAQKGLPGGGAAAAPAAASAESSSVDAESVASVSQPAADRPAARLAAEATAAGQVAQRRSEQEREGGERGAADAGPGAAEGAEGADDVQTAAGADAALRPQSEPRPAGAREASPGLAPAEPAGDAPSAEAGAAAAEEVAGGASRLKLSDD